MDHLPHPKNPKFPPPSIPYLAAQFPDLEYEVGDFYGFSKRYQAIKRQGMRGLFLQVVTADSFLCDLCAFQSWCFIGLSIEFFRVWNIRIEIKDLTCPAQTANQLVDTVITTQDLPTHLLRLEAKTRGFHPEDEDEVAEQFIEVHELMTAVDDILSELDIENIRNIERKLELKNCPEGLLFDRVYLSIALLGEALKVGANFLNTYPQNWVACPWLEERMLEAGWCRSEVCSLLDQCGNSPSTIYYLDCLDRHPMQRQAEHQHCGDDFRCNLENLDPATYRTRHRFDCSESGCRMPIVDTLDAPVISKMVMTGKIPLAAISGNCGVERVKIVDASALQHSGEFRS